MSRRVKLAGHVELIGEESNAYRILVRNPERKRPLARPRYRWVDNRKMNHREIGRDGMNGTDLAQDRDQFRTSCEHFRVP
jgi:hypothetical protein